MKDSSGQPAFNESIRTGSMFRPLRRILFFHFVLSSRRVLCISLLLSLPFPSLCFFLLLVSPASKVKIISIVKDSPDAWRTFVLDALTFQHTPSANPILRDASRKPEARVAGIRSALSRRRVLRFCGSSASENNGFSAAGRSRIIRQGDDISLGLPSPIFLSPSLRCVGRGALFAENGERFS